MFLFEITKNRSQRKTLIKILEKSKQISGRNQLYWSKFRPVFLN
jgi:hypothetical protein